MNNLKKFAATVRHRGLGYALRKSGAALSGTLLPEDRYAQNCHQANASFLRHCSGVLHVGANHGQEAETYAHAGKPAVWVEALPEVFKSLQENIARHRNQRALNATLSDRSGEKLSFHVSEQGGLQSSLYPPGGEMKRSFSQVRFVREIEVETLTASDLYERERLGDLDLDYLVLDVQGAELRVLKGFGTLLGRFRYLEVEFSRKDVYKGGVLFDELRAFLSGAGFSLMLEPPDGLVHGITYWENASLPKYFSQLGQDRWIAETVFPGGHKGFFLDIGAFDGRLLSNTLSLERYRGWSGLCVEPGQAFAALARTRACKLSHDCVGSGEGELIHFHDDGLFGGKELNRFTQALRRKVKTVPLTRLLDEYQCPLIIDYLSIDTEGSEYEILKDLDFGKYRVRAMTIEHNHEEPKRSLIANLLEKHGFVREREADWDDWYVEKTQRPSP